MSRKRRNNARNTSENRGSSRRKAIPLITPPKRISKWGRSEITARTPNQPRYIQAIKDNDLTICVGPAGTGKTYVAVAMAMLGMKDELYESITIARPMVDAGESTGFLPGTIHDKLAPYLRPIYNQIAKFVDKETITRWINEGKIDVVAFAHMRGLTFENSFVIGDECQNATEAQLDMLVTRFGESSKMVISGDCTQSDLGSYDRGYLQELALDIAPRMRRMGSDTAVVELNHSDIIRHKLVKEFVLAKKESKDEKESSKNSSSECRLPTNGDSQLEESRNIVDDKPTVSD